ncbi:MarR family winged helix-turn-helix transcriptional regulator [Brevibacillus sp. B_LB10_24]|uniref:MarR family winged helix-turn-helix transcriptional regulator n=1 Tax=Brevibacillus sp. B_LB10_24 TaxID=3380645 RepID=UPI0038B97892
MEERSQLAKLLSVMVHKFIVAYGKILDSDLSGSQVYILEILDEEGAKKGTELAERLEISLPAITNLANKLVKKGYIVRQVPESDRRVTLLQITPLGSQVLERINQKYLALTNTLWAGFSAEELDDLLKYYRRMVDNLLENQADEE